MTDQSPPYNGEAHSLQTKWPQVAVTGCGSWGKNLVRNFAELGALGAACDANPVALSRVKEQYHDIRTTGSYAEVLSDPRIQAIAIAMPASDHFAHARQALEAVKDVFVEKPLALTVADGRALIEMAEKGGRLLMVGHLLRYHPAVIKLKELVDSGSLGKIYYVYSNRLNLGKFRTEENILWGFAPHDISAILYLLGERPVEVQAHGGNYLDPNRADVTLTSFRFSSGVESGCRYRGVSPGVLRCSDLDEDAPLPEVLKKGTRPYREYKDSEHRA